MIPDYLTKEHVLQALEEIDRDGVDDAKARSRVHTLYYEHKSYPPKYVITIANRIATGSKLKSREYNTTEAQAYLKALDPAFVIRSEPVTPQQELVERYKVYLGENKLRDERYKWELVKRYAGRPDLNAVDFGEEITTIDYGNLIFYDAIAVRNHLARVSPEAYRDAFKVLFNEEIPLQDRIEQFQAMVRAAYHQLEPQFSDRHDERTIATFLTFYRPDLYSFYKNSFYRKFCRKLQLRTAPAGQKYPHYLQLTKDFIHDHVQPDEELIEQVDACLTEMAYPDPNKTILAQDILYRMLDKRYETFTAILDDLSESLAEENDSLRHFYLGARKDSGLAGIGDSYAWIIADGDSLSTVDAHFEVSVRILKKPMVCVDIHFEGKKKKTLLQQLGMLPANCEPFEWHGGTSIRYKGGIGINDEDLIEKIKAQIRYLDVHLGDQIRHILTGIINNQQPAVKAMHPTTLNQILFGPPGTGKTYHTINHALQIINEEPEKALKWADREAVTRLFRQRVREGRIVFTTFHQSLSYEDFIEGLKPETTDENKVVYRVRDGLFKKLCLLAARPTVKTDNFEIVYRQLLAAIDAAPDKKIVLETLVHAKEFTIYKNSKDNIRFHANTEKAYEGVIRKDYLKEYLLTGQTLDWPSYTRAVGEYMRANYGYDQQQEFIPQNYVLIMDEINRGNVSQVFGELITLIEEDKRTGRPEALSVTLPYSQSEFGVPANIFLIGTMNTADRSVEALDTALRRRFVFHEMPPKPELITGVVDGIGLRELLQTINDRISVLLDRDHLIGHSFFIQVKTLADLKQAIHHKVIPLLQEYFYGDYGKIGLVLGEGFVQVKKNDRGRRFASFKHYDSSVFEEREQYVLVDYDVQENHQLLIAETETTVSFRQAINYLMESN